MLQTQQTKNITKSHLTAYVLMLGNLEPIYWIADSKLVSFAQKQGASNSTEGAATHPSTIGLARHLWTIMPSGTLKVTAVWSNFTPWSTWRSRAPGAE